MTTYAGYSGPWVSGRAVVVEDHDRIGIQVCSAEGLFPLKMADVNFGNPVTSRSTT